MKKETALDFDSLFSTIMEENYGLDDGADDLSDMEIDELDQGDETGDSLDEDGEVTITLSSSHVEALREILDQLDGEEGESEGDVEDIEDIADEEGDDIDPFGEAVDAQPVSDSKGKSLTGTNNKAGNLKKSSGKAHKGDPKNEPEPKEHSDNHGKSLQSPGNDKPAGSTVTPGEAFK